VVTEAIVLAGGLGTRLRSAVPDLPKPMAPIAGRPFLSYLLRFLELNGVRRVILAVGYQRAAISDFFGSKYGGLELCYSVEETPLGTGGALLQALGEVQTSVLFVLNGDTFLRLDYQRLAAVLEQHPDAKLAVALRRVSDANRYGAVQVVDGCIQGFSARGAGGAGLINAGSYVMSRNIFEGYALPRKFSWEHDFLESRVSTLRALAYECDVPFIDIGIPQAFEQAQTLIPEWVGADVALPH
jgi:D-glycero-alpha-D-manno-heptose 1-phosphate guanylyltransferase